MSYPIWYIFVVRIIVLAKSLFMFDLTNLKGIFDFNLCVFLRDRDKELPSPGFNQPHRLHFHVHFCPGWFCNMSCERDRDVQFKQVDPCKRQGLSSKISCAFVPTKERLSGKRSVWPPGWIMGKNIRFHWLVRGRVQLKIKI